VIDNEREGALSPLSNTFCRLEASSASFAIVRFASRRDPLMASFILYLE
jgi:hypothetical protein